MAVMIDYEKIPRAQIVTDLRARDGDVCAYPGCDQPLDPSILDGPMLVTIDHWIPQFYGKAEGWTREQIWDLSNLKLMHRKCNAKKGDLIPNEDGTLPEKPVSKFRYRREARAQRPEICTSCNAGRDLDYGQVCASCNSGPMPERFPRWAKMKASECDHELFWCAWCSIGIIERPSATSMALIQGESGEWE